jgi:hypothetical protein
MDKNDFDRGLGAIPALYLAIIYTYYIDERA